MACAEKSILIVRVLLITGSYPPMACGVGDYTSGLAKALVAHGDISVCVLTSKGASEHDIVNALQVFPIMNNWTLVELFKAVKVIWSSCSDIVHIQYPTQGYKGGLLSWFIPLIALLMRKKVVQTWHEIYSSSNDIRLLIKGVVSGGLVVVRPEYEKKLPTKLQWILRNKKMRFIRNASAIPNINLSKRKQAEVKRKYIKEQKRLIVFFGFIYPHKGTELLFDIADPELDQIVIAGQFGSDDKYHQKILERANAKPWAGKVTITGFLSSQDIASLLAVSDAVILPFRTGGGEWNTSIHTAVLQKSFVLTTSESCIGYDEKNNVYYSEIDNIQEMKTALDAYAGKRRINNSEIDRDEWERISDDHYALYKTLLN